MRTSAGLPDQTLDDESLDVYLVKLLTTIAIKLKINYEI